MSSKLQLISELHGDQMGSYFGYSLTTMDANGDGRNDLVVSAPLHSNFEATFDQYEHGRVYLYLQSDRSEMRLARTLQSDQCRARFGISLVNCGDLNKDGFEDLAVGAPYDGPNGNGLVYIYSGSRSGLHERPSQILAPEMLIQPGPTGSVLRTFGWSLASGMDLNNDDYPDLLVGAYESDAVAFFRTRPLLDMKVKFDVQPANISLENRECSKIDGTQVACVTVTVCLAFNGPRFVPNKLRFLWTTWLDVNNNASMPRMYVVNMNNDHLNVNKGVLALERGKFGHCNKFKAYIQDVLQDKRSPIVLQLDFVIQNYHNLASNSRLHTPMLDQMQPNHFRAQVNIQRNCGRDNVCVPDLKVDVTK